MDAHEVNEQKKVLRKLKIACVLCLSFMLVEVTGGILAKSLAVLSDAAHLCTDLSSFLIAIMAANLSMKPASSKYTYGMIRAEVLSALASISVLILLTIYFVIEASYRIYQYTQGNMDPVDGKLMSIVAGIGIVVNVALAFVLGEHHVHMDHHDSHDDCCDHGHDHGHSHGHDNHDEESGMVTLAGKSGKRHRSKKEKRGKKKADPDELSIPLMATQYGSTHDHNDHGHVHGHGHDEHDDHDDHHEKKSNVNLDAAFIHVLGDLIQSVAVFLAGLLIWWKPHWQVADPICTILFSFIVFHTTSGILKTTTNVLLEGVPGGIKWEQVKREVNNVPGVSNVHDLHIWSISVGKPALSVHCVAEDPRSAMIAISGICKKHKIVHSTVQIQSSQDLDCLVCGTGKSGHNLCA